jgi:hypothetical protein
MNNLVGMNFIRQNYKLPDWFEVHDIDWRRFYCVKNDERIEDDKRFDAFKRYLKLLDYVYHNREYDIRWDLSQSDIDDILTIRICDYSWDGAFTWSQPKYDKTSTSFILEKL